jgi:hypothetical protein
VKRFLLILGCLIACSTAQANYSGYTYRRTLTINHAYVPNTDQTNFPVLISTIDVTLSSNTGSGGRLNSTAFDLVFSTMNDCSFLLNWDTETVMNVGISSMNVWVKLPKVTTASDTTLYMCYGNSSITTYQGFSTGTWDSNYLGVFHMPYPGMTVQSVGGAPSITTVGSPLSISSGVVDGGVAISYTNYLASGGTSDYNLTTSGTVSAWFYETVSVGNGGLVGKDNFDSDTNGYIFEVQNLKLFLELANGSSSQGIASVSSFSLNTWQYGVVTWNNSQVIFYVNGTADTPVGQTITPVSNVYAMHLGTDGNAGLRNMYGNMDETRISNNVRSADWIKTEYNNQNSPSTFVTIGAETGTATPPGNAFFFGEF